MQSGAGRPGRDAERLGNLADGQADEVVEDENRPVFGRQPPEALLELVPVGKPLRSIVADGPIGDTDLADPRRPASRTACLAVAGPAHEPVCPCVEPLRIAQTRKILPGIHERLLQSVLGTVRIPEDADGDRVQAIRDEMYQGGECLLVTSLRTLDELALHRAAPLERAFPVRSLPMGCAMARIIQPPASSAAQGCLAGTPAQAPWLPRAWTLAQVSFSVSVRLKTG